MVSPWCCYFSIMFFVRRSHLLKRQQDKIAHAMAELEVQRKNYEDEQFKTLRHARIKLDADVISAEEYVPSRT
jgi:hypothetical protein